MQAEAQEYLKKARTVQNVADKRGRLVQKAIRYLTCRERLAREEEMAHIKGTLDQPAWALKDLSAEGRANLTKRRNFLEDDLTENGPPTDIDGQTKDLLNFRIKELEEQIRDRMPTVEVMRRNPPGAVDMHRRWETSNKGKILEWKNLKRLLEPANDEKDFTNIELLRPSGLSPETAASFMMRAQIPGNFAMTPLAKANWPLGDPKVDTALKQAERQEVAEQMIVDGAARESEIEELKAALKEAQEKLAAKEIIKIQRARTKQAQRERMKKYWADRKAKTRSLEQQAT